MPLSSSRTETNENDAERPPVTTQNTTEVLPADRTITDPDLAEITHAWAGLPDAIRAAMIAMVRASTNSVQMKQTSDDDPAELANRCQ